MNCSDDNLCFDFGTHVEAFGVLENSIGVLGTQTLQLYWIMLEISGCYNPLLMIIPARDFRTREAPPFMAGSSHRKISINAFLILVNTTHVTINHNFNNFFYLVGNYSIDYKIRNKVAQSSKKIYCDNYVE